MRYVFAIVLVIHGLIHLMGFVKAFYLTDINKQILGISKPIGSLWLFVFILFIISASQFLTHKKWFYVAFIALFVSQILIIMTWKEAKFGTIINIIIFLVSISAFGNHRFEQIVQTESNQLLSNLTSPKTELIAEHEVTHLPKIVQKWLFNSGVIGNKRITSVYLEQAGKMKTKPNGNWLSFSAEQYFNVKHPAFVWSTKVELNWITNLVGRDKFSNGEGEMLIKLAGLIPVVNETNNEIINSASMLRYLAETIWFPSAAINDYMTWESIEDHKAIATFTYQDKTVSGVFEFSAEGEVVSFEAQRYYSSEKEACLETWFISLEKYKVFGGYKIPTKCEVIWKLKEGNFNWLNFEISNVTYNLISSHT